jgi:hypothetical protein
MLLICNLCFGSGFNWVHKLPIPEASVVDPISSLRFQIRILQYRIFQIIPYLETLLERNKIFKILS